MFRSGTTTWAQAAIIPIMLFIAAGTSVASPIDITICRENYSGTGWYGPQQDQSVSPGCITGQAWDLEGFFLDGTMLSMVGGWDFQYGWAGSHHQPTGDIFFDVDGDAQYGTLSHAGAQYPANSAVNDTFGYDFVMRMDWANLAYTVFDISDGATVLTSTRGEAANWASDPWAYEAGGADLGLSGAIDYTTGLSDAAVAAAGYGALLSDGATPYHNIASFDIGWLAPYLASGEFIAHITMECGNDSMMGLGSIPQAPEPATLLLIGVGVAGMVLRKRVRLI